MKRVFKPGAGRVLVSRRVAEKTIKVGGATPELYKAEETIDRETKTAEWATVVRVGDDEVTDYGTTVRCPWSVGQEVYIGRQYGRDFDLDGTTMTLLRFNDVMGGWFEEEE